LGGAAVGLGSGALALADAGFHVSVIERGAFVAMAVFFATLAGATGSSPASRFRRAGTVCALGFLIAMVNWTVEKKFVRALYRVQPGMPEAQARQILGSFPEGTGWPTNPFAGAESSRELEIANHLVFRSSDEPGNSNWGMVELGLDRRVVTVRFSPD
jgi:hypothetical protein